LKCSPQTPEYRSAVVSHRDDETVGRLSVHGRRVSGVPLVEGVRGHGQAIVLRGSGTELALTAVDLYADDLITRGYQLHERLHVGASWEIYRASRFPQQPNDVTSSSQLSIADGTKNLPVQCVLDCPNPASLLVSQNKLLIQLYYKVNMNQGCFATMTTPIGALIIFVIIQVIFQRLLVLCRSAWVRCSRPSVCLFVCLSAA